MIRYRSFLTLPALAVLGFLALGCAPNRSLGTRVRNSDGTWGLEPRVIINNRQIEKNVVIEAIDSRMVNDIGQVEVRLRNRSSKPLDMVYRYAWSDAGNFVIETPGGGWREAWIEGYQTKTLSGVAPSARAANFRLEIQKKQ